MSSLKKIEANRRNAQASTGPRTPEGKAAISGNAITSGLRATKHLLYFERYADFERTCCELADEWQPATPTEAHLIEQMAIAQAKLVRLESNLSHCFYQSFAMKCASCEDEITDKAGVVHPPDFIVEREFQVQKMINGISQHIARVERAWHKALDALQKLQDRRRKESTRRPAAVETVAAPAPVRPAATPESAAALDAQAKNDEQSHRGGDQIPAKEVDSERRQPPAGSALPKVGSD